MLDGYALNSHRTHIEHNNTTHLCNSIYMACRSPDQDYMAPSSLQGSVYEDLDDAAAAAGALNPPRLRQDSTGISRLPPFTFSPNFFHLVRFLCVFVLKNTNCCPPHSPSLLCNIFMTPNAYAGYFRFVALASGRIPRVSNGGQEGNKYAFFSSCSQRSPFYNMYSQPYVAYVYFSLTWCKYTLSPPLTLIGGL